MINTSVSILFNATNLHGGGGVQVATSFINELSLILKENVFHKTKFFVACSSTVFNNLPAEFDFSPFDQFVVFDLYGFTKNVQKCDVLLNHYDYCFTIFGPVYFNVKALCHIVGFAQPWIAYPNSAAYYKVDFYTRLKFRLKYFVQKVLFTRYDLLVVEQENVKSALVSIGFSEEKVKIVSNTISSVFFNKQLWEKVTKPHQLDCSHKTLGFLGRAYPHKNLEILINVDYILKKKYGLEFNFIFTLDEEDMNRLGFAALSNFHSVGPIKASQCPTFYQMIDGLIFPSLLECFSATPIEAMYMRIPVFASDLPFIRSVCQESVYYFNPLDAGSIADTIIFGFNDFNLDNKLEAGVGIVDSLPTANQRAVAYLSLIKELEG